MRKLSITSLAAVALLSAVTATPAAAKPRAVNGQIAFFRDDPAVGHVIYTINPDGSHEHQVLPGILAYPRWSPDGSEIVADATGQDAAAAWIIDPDTGTHRALPNPDPAAFAPFACGVPSPDFSPLACSGFGRTDPSLNGIY